MPACHAGDRRFESGRVRQFPLASEAIIRISPASRPFVITLAALLVVAGLVSGFAAGQGFFAGSTPTSASPRPTSTGLANASPTPTAEVTARPTPTGGSPIATPHPTPTSTPPALVRATVPLVPVVSFWSNASSISAVEIVAAVEGRNADYAQVVVPIGAGEAVADALGTVLGMNVLEAEPSALREAVADGALGLLPLPQVSPAVRALAVDGVRLFGIDRSASLEDWPLEVTLDLPQFAWDQAQTWTLAAGGDILLDRGVAYQVKVLDKGVDFPWNGGTVSITGHHCCTPFGWPVPETQRTGNQGAVRSLFGDADLAIANLESPVKDSFTYHEHGLTFTGDPRLLEGLDNAGLDLVSLANNHIGNGGRSGIVGSGASLDELGIAHAGAGIDLVAAAEPAFLEAGGQRVAVIGCAVVGGYFAREGRWGALRCADPTTVAAITEARAEADVVVVFPHWGREYQAVASRGQRKLAEVWMAAGADVVIGSHSHWAGAIEEIDGRLVFYGLGNLVFDQTWSEATMAGLILELTFQGDRLVQAWLHPTLIMSAAQPNLLDYGGGGSDVLARVRDASRRLDY
jgi:hypothetical protein